MHDSALKICACPHIGSVKYGGTYLSNKGSTGDSSGVASFTPIQEKTLTTSYTLPTMPTDISITGEVRLYVIPVVELIFYDIVPGQLHNCRGRAQGC